MTLSNKITKLCAIIPISVVLVIINILRIFKVPITIDETGYVPSEGYLFTMYKSYPSANNHILNSLLRKFFVENFGDNIFFLRFDSLLAQLVFLFFSYKLFSKLFQDPLWVVLGFIVLNTFSPFVFDFWGLSRGYGLGMAFLLMSIYYAFDFFSTTQIRQLVFSLFAGLLAVYSNFGFLSYYVALIGVIAVHNLFNTRERLTAKWVVSQLVALIVVSGIMAALIVKPLIIIKKGGEMGFLGQTGFKADTINSLVACTLYNGGAIERTKLITNIVFGSLFLCGGFWILCFLRDIRAGKRCSAETRNGILFYLLLVLPCLLLVIEFRLFKINYLISRAAVYFTILYAFQPIYICYYLREVKFRMGIAAMVVVLAITSFNFWSNINFRYAFLWWFNSADIIALRKMASEHSGKPGKIKISVNGLFVQTISYDVNHYFKQDFDVPQTFDGEKSVDSTLDFYYVWKEESNKVPSGYELDTLLVGAGDCALLHRKK